MKSSSGRAHSAATLAATALCGLAALLLPGAGAYAQKTPVFSNGPAVRDGTPAIDALIAQKNWPAALTQLDARIASHPRDVQAQFKRATVLVHLNRDSDAIAAYVALTQAYPELPEPYNNLAALYAKEGRYEEARETLETATKANPNYGLAYENLGDLYLRLAASAYQRAADLGEASGPTQQRLADIREIVSPHPGTPSGKAAAAAAPGARAQTAPSDVVSAPSFQFGGSNGPFAMPPYTAPSQ
jgi:tetratricopeptide (TPR) repeat protein